jgi:alpha-tubulin suppressor-like RCC1 family protein
MPRLWSWLLPLIAGFTLFLHPALSAAAERSLIACGDDHALAIQRDGTLWAWGDNTNGQLGLGDTTLRRTPVKVGNSTSWVAVAAGHRYSLGLQADGSLWS